MDMTSLQVFNVIHKLGLTEQELGVIEEEQTHEERTGFYIGAVKGNLIVGISHDERHQIMITKFNNGHKAVAKSRILFKTLINFNIPQEIYTLHGIAQYRALDTEIKYRPKNLEELKDRVCDRYADTYPKELGGKWEDVYTDTNTRERNAPKKVDLIQEQLKAICWLFGEDIKEIKLQEINKNLLKIIKVFQRNNRRIAIIQQNEDFQKQRGGCFGGGGYAEHIKRTTFHINTFKPRNKFFNYVCEGREIYLEYDQQVWIDDDLKGKVTAEELEVISENSNDKSFLLTADIYNEQKQEVRIKIMSAKREAQEDKLEGQLHNKIKKQFKNGSVTRHGITFTKKSIEYEGLVLKGKKIGEFLFNNSIVLQERPDFGEIFKGYVAYAYDLCISNGKVNNLNLDHAEFIHIGKVSIKAYKRGKQIYVNGFRVRREDLLDVVCKAIEYEKQKDFDDWLHCCSRFNLDIQEALKNGGVKYELKIDSTDDNCLSTDSSNILLALPLFVVKGRVFTKIRGKEYACRGSILELGKELDTYYNRTKHLQRTIKILNNSINGLTPKQIAEIISEGKTEFVKFNKKAIAEEKAKLDKSKEFLAHAVKLTKATKIKGEYVVTGTSKRKYFIAKNGGVWTLEKGKKKYLCLIDSSNDGAEGEAGLNDQKARRLLMLHKDQKVAKGIWERGDRMDKLWRDIMEEEKKETGEAI